MEITLPVSSKHRWVACGKLTLRRFKDKKRRFSEFNVEVLSRAIAKRFENDDVTRSMGERMMWIVDQDCRAEFTLILLSMGDKATSDAAYVNFETKVSREIKKGPNEGGHVSSHILVKNQPEKDGSHLIFVEYNSGITLNAISLFFNWILNQDMHMETVTDEGKTELVRVVNTIVGAANRTLADVMTTGVVKDVEFVGVKRTESHQDEDEIVQEVVDAEVWKIHQSVACGTLKEFARKITNKYKSRKKLFDDNKIFVRIRTENDQNKTTQVNCDEEDIFQQAFIEHEKIQGFPRPLPQSYNEFNQSIVDKIIELTGEQDA